MHDEIEKFLTEVGKCHAEIKELRRGRKHREGQLDKVQEDLQGARHELQRTREKEMRRQRRAWKQSKRSTGEDDYARNVATRGGPQLTGEWNDMSEQVDELHRSYVPEHITNYDEEEDDSDGGLSDGLSHMISKKPRNYAEQ